VISFKKQMNEKVEEFKLKVDNWINLIDLEEELLQINKKIYEIETILYYELKPEKKPERIIYKKTCNIFFQQNSVSLFKDKQESELKKLKENKKKLDEQIKILKIDCKELNF
jgi:hypothetical protein